MSILMNFKKTITRICKTIQTFLFRQHHLSKKITTKQFIAINSILPKIIKSTITKFFKTLSKTISNLKSSSSKAIQSICDILYHFMISFDPSYAPPSQTLFLILSLLLNKKCWRVPTNTGKKQRKKNFAFVL